MFRTSARAQAATTGAFAAIAILAGACSSPDTASETAPSVLPASFETDGLSITADDVVTAVATSGREGDTTVLTSPTTLDARISVADEALPDGISGDELTATVLSFDSEADGASAITFELGPDGAEFEEPVLLEWEGPWAPNASYSLAAFDGDGTPVEDTGRTDANSIAALRVEPTSDTTARYTLPVDHFSSWSVNMSVELAKSSYFAAQFAGQSDFDGVVGVDTAASVTMRSAGVKYSTGGSGAKHRICASGRVMWVDGPVSASFDQAEPACTQTTNGDIVEQKLGLTLRCSAVRASRVRIAVYSLVTFERDAAQQGPTGPAKIAELKEMMLRHSWQLQQQASGGATAAIDNDLYQGAMFAAQTTLSVACADAQSTSITSATSTPSTTSAAGTPDTSSATTTTKPATTTTKPATTSSTPTGGSVPATPTTSGGGTSSATTPTSTPPVSAPPVTSAVPTSTSPATTAPATTAPATTPTTTSWGPEGAWAFNEFGSCNYNGTGGCGWYYGGTPGEYVLGPIGP